MRQTKLLFYQYKPLNNADHLKWLENYLGQKVWFTRACKLNDPFEGICRYQTPTLEEWQANPDYPSGYSSKIGRPLPTSVSNRRGLEHELLPTVGVASYGAHFPNAGVLCLTLERSNIPMWAHYADNHQGYCVVFELDLDLLYDTHEHED
jgi:hypothetical protein